MIFMCLTYLKNDDAKIIFALFILGCIFFWKIILNPGKVVFSEYFSDIIQYSMPIKTFVHDFWKASGTLPLWNPYTFMGNPSLGNTQYAMFHPYNIVYLLFDPPPIFGYIFILDLFLIGLFTYFFVKSIGVNKYGALVSAITFMFSGVVLVRVYSGHHINLDILAMIPPSFFLIEMALKKKSYFYGVLTGIPIALGFLGGNIQVAVYGVVGLTAYFTLRILFLAKKSTRDLKLLLILVIAVLFGALLSAVQLLPSFELSTFLSRAQMTYEDATAYSFPPEQSITFFMPEFFGTYLDYTYWGGRNFWELCAYTGVLSTVLTAISMFFVKNEYKTIFTILLVFSFLFSLGKNFPMYAIFYKFVPFFDVFRKPTVMLFLTSFSISVLSGFGTEFLSVKITDKDKKNISKFMKAVLIVPVFTMIVLVLTYTLKDEILSVGKGLLLSKYEHFTSDVHSLPYELEFYMDKIPYVYSHIVDSLTIFIVTLVGIISVLYLRIRNMIKADYFKLALLVITLIDLWFFGMKYIDVMNVETVFGERPILGLLETDTERFRVLDISGSLPQYVSISHKIETMGGYESVQLKNYTDFIDYYFGSGIKESGYSFLGVKEERALNNSKILGMLNVKYVLTRTPTDNKNLILRSNVTTTLYVKSLSNIQYKSNRGGYIPSNLTMQVYIYENIEFLPRAFIVRDASINGSETVLEEMSRRDFNPRETIIFENDPGVQLNNPGTYKEATIEHHSPNEIMIRVYMDNPGFLVLSENYLPGWKAFDNGSELDIYKANYILRSVYLTEGWHTVKFVYNPLSFKVGGLITFISTLVLCVIILDRIKSNLRRGTIK